MATGLIHKLEKFLTTNPSQTELKAWMDNLPPDQHAECALHLVHLAPTGFVRVMSPEHKFRNADSLSDNELFEKLSQALSDVTDTRSGKIGLVDPRANPEPISRFASLYNEAVRRGFQKDDIGFGMQPHLDKCDKLTGFGDPDWQRFEKLVARIHIALCRDADVKWSEKLIDKSGTERQLDVTVRTRTGPHEVLGIIQCKYEKRSVSIADVESFISTKQDLNAGLAIMVSRSGYQTGAEAKAKLHDVRLWTLVEAEQASWREEIRTFELRYPMVDEINICPAISFDAFPRQEGAIDFGAVIIAKADKIFTLESVLAQAIQNATERCLPVPCWLEFDLGGSTISMLGKTFPLEKLEFHFARYIIVAHRKNVNIPMGKSYVFRRTDGKGLSIAERDLPPLPNGKAV
jgi:hypothetical protein